MSISPDDLQYQKTRSYFAQVADGMEALAAAELTELGAEDVQTSYRGVRFSGPRETMQRANYQARLISRVLAPLISFDCHSDRYLYKTARKLPWTQLMALDDTFAVRANVAQSNIRHSQFAALRVKDAIVDSFRDEVELRPDVDADDPDVGFHLHLHRNRATIYLDCSGGSLHRRGYRQESVEAPLSETLGAAIVRLSEWNGERPLVDPMCGSGTLLCEAMMHAAKLPAGVLRKRFGFERMPDFDAGTWRSLKRGIDEQMQAPKPGLLRGSDADLFVVDLARRNSALLPFGSTIDYQRARFQELEGLEDTTILCNPPYGKRLGNRREMGALVKELGDFFKQRCQGATAFVYLGERELVKHIGLRPVWKKPLKNGQLDGRLLKLELY